MLVAAAVAAKAAGLAPFSAYPRLELALGPGEIALAAVVVALACASFAGAGARLGVGRVGATRTEAADG
ncbi:MAG: hypothetical protein WKF33_01540 [Thermoleophilaceae bacterium]